MATNFGRIAVVGFPETGKSTLLAAWYGCARDANYQSEVTTARFAGDEEYAREIHEAWQQFRALERTQDPKQEIVLHLTTQSVGEFELNFTDVHGEGYRQVVEEAHVREDIGKALDASKRLILVLRPNRTKPVALIDDVLAGQDTSSAHQPTAGETAQQPTTGASAPDSLTAAANLNDFSEQNVPTDVRAVFLLNALANPPFGVGRKDLLVLVSAWDAEVLAEAPTPVAWLRRRMPLLWQYLEANSKLYRSQFFGISAQGGDYGNAADQRRFDAANSRSELCYSVDSDGNRLGIFAPLLALVRMPDGD